MKYVFAVDDESELHRYKSFLAQHKQKLDDFLEHLQKTYEVHDLPRCVVLTGAEIATQFISDLPIPAYTNDYRTIFCPEKAVWQKLYLRQLQGWDSREIRQYYETALTENSVLQILGHEFVHHSDLFIDEAYERARWFEEGMCEYISRRFFLTDSEFAAEARINAALLSQYEEYFGKQALEGFSADTYSGSYEDIFFFYWKSFLAVNRIISEHNGDILAVFRSYRDWFDTSTSLLTEWFNV